jgi:hypothetical protein
MNVRQHNCGRGFRLDPGILGVARADFFSADEIFFAGRLFASLKTESICAEQTRY